MSAGQVATRPGASEAQSSPSTIAPPAEGAFHLESQCQTLAPLLRGSFFNKQKARLQAHQLGLRPGLRAPTLRVASPAPARRTGGSTTASVSPVLGSAC